MLDDDKNELKAIEEVIQNYGEAFNEWNIEKLVNSFHPEARTVWFIPERGGYITGMCYGWVRSFVRNQKEDLSIKFHVTPEEIHQKGTAAYARVRFLIDDPEGPRDTTDYLTLIKFGSNWNVINKSGFTEDIPKEEFERRLKNKTEQPRNNPKEIEQIKTILETYADAFHEYNFKKIEETFHPDVKLTSYNPDKEEFWNEPRPIFRWKEAFLKQDEIKTKFDIAIGDIDQTGTSAIAIMKWIAHKSTGTGYTTDFLTLLKIDKKWRIVNKTCDISFKEEKKE